LFGHCARVLYESASFTDQILALLTKRNETGTCRTECPRVESRPKVRAREIRFAGAPNENKREEIGVSDGGTTGENALRNKR
jgi:hypothetical protein